MMNIKNYLAKNVVNSNNLCPSFTMPKNVDIYSYLIVLVTRGKWIKRSELLCFSQLAI